MKIALALLLLLVLFAGFTLWKAARHETRAEAAFPPEGQFLDVDGHRVHAVVMGEGPDLVLIHGSSGNTRDMTFSLAPKLAESYRVFIFDRPGLGYTERINRSGATISQQATLFSAAARQLGAERPIVVGHSYGGAVALAWAVEQPERIAALVLLSAPTQPWDSPLDLFYRITSGTITGPLAIPLITAYVDDTRVERALDDIFEPQEPPQGYKEYVGPGLTLRRMSLRANAMQRSNLLDEITALQPRYPEISVPVELLHGTADTTVGLSIHALPFLEQVPQANLTRLEGVGHMTQHVSQPETLAAIDRAARAAGLK